VVRQQQHEIVLLCPFPSVHGSCHLDLRQIEFVVALDANHAEVSEDRVEPNDSN
jgi:hypothetical protein